MKVQFWHQDSLEIGDLDTASRTITPSAKGGEPEGIWVPGFFDIHIHGANDCDTMDADPGTTRKMCEFLAEQGYAGILATTITAGLPAVQRAIDALPDHPLIWGVHLEGPFVSSQYPGAQPSEYIINPEKAGSAWETVLQNPKLRLVTLAPEIPGGFDLIKSLTKRGVKVSLGHTAATAEEAKAAWQAGAKHITHIFNAMKGIHHRDSALILEALSNDDLYTELIYDRQHVSRLAAEVLLRCKPKDKILAISDGTRAIGLAAGSQVEMWGHRCLVGDGKVTLESNGSLAGSCITLRDAFFNLASDFGWEAAVRSCCINPRIAMGESIQRGQWNLWSLKGELLERGNYSTI